MLVDTWVIGIVDDFSKYFQLLQIGIRTGDFINDTGCRRCKGRERCRFCQNFLTNLTLPSVLVACLCCCRCLVHFHRRMPGCRNVKIFRSNFRNTFSIAEILQAIAAQPIRHIASFLAGCILSRNRCHIVCASRVHDRTIVNLNIPAGEILSASQKVFTVDFSITIHIECDHIDNDIPAGKILPQTKKVLGIDFSVAIDIARKPIYNLNSTILDLEFNIFLIKVNNI